MIIYKITNILSDCFLVFFYKQFFTISFHFIEIIVYTEIHALHLADNGFLHCPLSSLISILQNSTQMSSMVRIIFLTTFDRTIIYKITVFTHKFLISSLVTFCTHLKVVSYCLILSLFIRYLEALVDGVWTATCRYQIIDDWHAASYGGVVQE